MNKLLFLFLFCGTLLMMVVMAKTGSSLKTAETPNGILDLELANTSLKTNRVIGAWKLVKDTDVVYNAKINTWLDFIFIFFYSLFLFYCCGILTANSKGWLNNIGHRFHRAIPIAGLFDIFENTGMFLSLNGHVSDINSIFTTVCSASKWLIVIFALLYIAIGGGVILYQKASKLKTKTD
ncbi:hypothetical protein BH11BAC3_BH11BAC3_19970 [soil metagenome]